MANGRSGLDCCYCLHWQCSEPDEWGYGSGKYDGRCTCWDVDIPRNLTSEHRFCLDFTPSKYFAEDCGIGNEEFDARTLEEYTRDRLMSYIKLHPGMRIGVLYHGQSNNPGDCTELMNLDRSAEKDVSA